MKGQRQRADLTLSPVATKLNSAAALGKQSDESRDQVFRYIRLTNLIPELLDMVDNSVLKEKDKLQMALHPAVELFYLIEDGQRALLEAMTIDDCTPLHAQTIKMRDFSEKGKPNADVILSIMQEEKPNQVEQFKMSKDCNSIFFSLGTPAQKNRGHHCEGFRDVPQTAEGDETMSFTPGAMRTSTI